MSRRTFRKVREMHFNVRAFFVAAILLFSVGLASNAKAQAQAQTQAAQQATTAQENQHGTG
ncbi:MAG TPA: hypothetical protein VKT50_01285, partial [Candidatus Acidoferrales bacterium]|nr:hypothetical protein [Candidatus Acidoferrales bacterium]